VKEERAGKFLLGTKSHLAWGGESNPKFLLVERGDYQKKTEALYAKDRCLTWYRGTAAERTMSLMTKEGVVSRVGKSGLAARTSVTRKREFPQKKERIEPYRNRLVIVGSAHGQAPNERSDKKRSSMKKGI